MKKAITMEYILCDSTYMKFKHQAKLNYHFEMCTQVLKLQRKARNDNHKSQASSYLKGRGRGWNWGRGHEGVPRQFYFLTCVVETWVFALLSFFNTYFLVPLY